MSEREDRVRLQHMLDAARQAIAFVQGRRRNDLDTDLQLTLALTRLVEIVGEAAKNASDEERQRHSEVPWRAIAGTRDRLAHVYFDVDLDQLWQIVAADLPALVPVLETFVEQTDLEVDPTVSLEEEIGCFYADFIPRHLVKSLRLPELA